MNRAFGTILSALGVGSACYVLAMASWQQVLFIFLFACLGWSTFVWSKEKRRALYLHPPIKLTPESLTPSVPAAQTPVTEPVSQRQPVAAPVYRPTASCSFPMHQLARAGSASE